MSLYSCRTIPIGYRMVKFDEDMNVESTYDMTDIGRSITCSCFQSSRSTCRHREMLKEFLSADKVDTGYFLDYETFKWFPALQIGDKQPFVRRV